jgi:hypothetical protein
MFEDGPKNDSIDATTYQGLPPNGVPCLLGMLAMRFGLCNASSSFSRLMPLVLYPFIRSVAIVYLGDICIYSKTQQEHLEHLRKVSTTLREHKLFIKMVNCFWAKREIEYIGFVVGSGIVRTSLSKVATVKDWPSPETENRLSLLLPVVLFSVNLFTILQIVRLHRRICAENRYPGE